MGIWVGTILTAECEEQALQEIGLRFIPKAHKASNFFNNLVSLHKACHLEITLN